GGGPREGGRGGWGGGGAPRWGGRAGGRRGRARAASSRLLPEPDLLADEERRRLELRVERHDPRERNARPRGDRRERVAGPHRVDAATRRWRRRPPGMGGVRGPRRRCRARRAPALAGAAKDDDADRGREQERGGRDERPPAPAGDGYHPETAQTSRRSRAASAPAAVRKSSPESRNA